MAFTTSQDILYVRVLIGDPDPDGVNRLFSNSEIAVFLERTGHPLLCAARMLDAIAVNEVLLSKVIRTQDLSTDGSKVADSLRKQARVLREEYEDAMTTLIIVDMQPTSPPELTEPRVWLA